MNVIFVAGIHAVGKSSTCKIVSDRTGIHHYTASKIIREEKSSAVDNNTKLVLNVVDNQRLLIQGVSRILKQGDIFLDGHFTMRRKLDGNIETVHFDVFKSLKVGLIIVFIDKPEEISYRLRSRDGISISSDIFHEHQEAEIAYAHKIATLLAVPMQFLQAFDTEGMYKIVTSWISEKKRLVSKS